MLLSLRHEAGMQRFLELNLRDLLREDGKQRDLLLDTLRAFFDANCSHEAAAQRLGVHRKTVSYRLGKISELTGLDLSTHDDRLVADLGALRASDAGRSHGEDGLIGCVGGAGDRYTAAAQSTSKKRRQQADANIVFAASI